MRKNLYLIIAFLSLLVSCEIVEPEAKKDLVDEDPIEEAGEEEALDLFYGSGDMGLFQDEENMIMLGHENGSEGIHTRLFRINKNGVKDTTFNDSELASSSDHIGWQNLLLGEDGHILVKGEFNIEGQVYKLAKLDRNGKIDHNFLKNLPPEFLKKNGDIPWLKSVKQHQSFYYAVFEQHIIKFNKNGIVDKDFDFRFSYSGDDGYFKTLTVLPDGKMMVMGQFNLAVGGKIYYDLIRIFPNGKVDSSFRFDYELVAAQMELHNRFLGSAYRMLPLLDGGFLLQGNFKAIKDLSSGLEQEHDYLVKLTPDFKVDTEFKFLHGENNSYYTQLADGRLLFFKTSLKNNFGYLLLVDSQSGGVLREIPVGLEMIGGSDPLIHEGRAYIFSMFYDWLFFAPNYEESIPFMSFEIADL